MSDLVPKGSIPLTEAYERYCTWVWNQHDPRTELELTRRLKPLPQERLQLHYAGADKVTDLLLREIVSPFSSGELEALVARRSGEDLAIPASSWREAFFPERLFLSDTIEKGHGSFIDEAVGRTPFVNRDSFAQWLRHRESQRERIGSASALREVVIGLVMDGVMTSIEAEDFATQWRLRPLSSRPKERMFNVNKQPKWTLAMTISWIVWRNPRKVREAWDDYRTERWEWFPFSRRLPVEGGKDWYDVQGEELRSLEPLNVLSLGMLEALDADADDRDKLLSVKSAREDLWRELSEGRIDATGLNANNAITKIPDHEWSYLELAGDLHGGDYVIQRSRSLQAAYRELRFSRIAVQGIWSLEAAADPAPSDSLFDLSKSTWTLYEAAIWVGSEGRRFSSKTIADEDLEVSGAIALFEKLFGDARLSATGLGPKRTREAIPAEYWELATIDPQLADQRHYVSFIDELLENDNGGQMTPFGEDRPRWHGIQLRRDALFEVFPLYAPAETAVTKPISTNSGNQRRSQRKRAATKEAIASVFPEGVPEGLSDKERLDAINKWLDSNGHSIVSLGTLNRARSSTR